MAELVQEIQTPNGFHYRQPLGLFINNEFAPSSNGQIIQAIDPATEKLITRVQAATEEDVDKAVRAARNALVNSPWTSLEGTERGILISKLADLVEENKELLASIDAWDNGKPFSVALNEDLPETINTLRYYAGWADKIFGQTISTTSSKFAYTLRLPIGVVAQIIPWNYPLSMAAWKLGPALACGNTIVLKAAEQTPLSILMLGQLIKQAGFPPGVVNLLNGLGRITGSALVKHALVDKVAFTGSTVTAKTILKMAAETLKNVTIETGGKSPLLVFSDADIEQAVRWSHLGIMSHQGQICTATSRILVQHDLYDSFVSQFKERIKTTSIIGDQWGKDTYHGPQVSKDQYNCILSYIQEGQKEGATLEMGGKACPINGKGYFILPTVFTNVEDHMTIYREEIFGPVVVISSFSTEEEAISRANDSIYGLGAAVFTRDLERAHRVAASIESGTVWVNSSQDCDPRIPFGGVKQSGIGRELGEAALDAYTQIKAIHVNLGSKL
ncbi:aldehyde dehydrogenase-like protein [Pestalotiopsis fici W106-1]|uniref:Aldehyde dehydrogenase-like protein n=1 Tax=Pestalotiopsis fici (strain W106-1 / CGMCC3.15140) TaxID=1229662 RepID=W3XPB4_PESFW|nr:aldehyde dehydrogenase-like protein [Pestalotiopsis fici W106-1]ETS87898.1 aldehyde dehydrogenase-like protein [Pestalotiopsis fici W106-1]